MGPSGLSAPKGCRAGLGRARLGSLSRLGPLWCQGLSQARLDWALVLDPFWSKTSSGRGLLAKGLAWCCFRVKRAQGAPLSPKWPKRGASCCLVKKGQKGTPFWPKDPDPMKFSSAGARRVVCGRYRTGVATAHVLRRRLHSQGLKKAPKGAFLTLDWAFVGLLDGSKGGIGRAHMGVLWAAPWAG